MLANAVTITCKCMLYVLAALIILIALLVACVRVALFYSADYSEELASLVSTYAGSPVEIGGVDLVWNRFDASASLKDVQILSPDGAEAVLKLPSLELQLNVRDILLQRRLSVRSVQLNKLSLEASYEGRGKLRMSGRLIGGQPLSQEQNNPAREHSVLAWLFNAERISILDSNITLVDAVNDRKYEVDNINIRAFNEADKHQIRISSALPGALGENSLAAFDFTGKADNIEDWTGRFYLNSKGLNIAELSEFWREPSQEYDGQVDLQVWGGWTGTRVDQLRVIASGANVNLQQPSSDGTVNTQLATDNIAVDLDWFRVSDGWQLTFNRLSAMLDDNDIQLSGLEMQLNHDADDQYFSVSGPNIDLQSLKPVSSFVDAMLPVDTPFKTSVVRRGLLQDWSFAGWITDDSTSLTDLQLNAVDLAIDPYGKIPGFSDLTASVVFENGTGRLGIDNQSVALALPELFDTPLPVFNVDGAIDFLVNTDKTITGTADDLTTELQDDVAVPLKWKAVSDDLRLSTIDLNTSASFSISGLEDGATLLDSRVAILNANLARTKDYLPQRIIKPELLNWLQTAITDGDVVRGRVEVKGDLKDFSPADGKGHFYAEGDLVGTTVKFRPDWPAARDMDGNLSFTLSGMRGRVYKGALREARFSDARLFISDFKRPIFELQTNAIGPLADMLDFAQTGPLAEKIGNAFGDSTGTGTSRLAMDVKVPLNKELSDELEVNGEVVVDNAQVNSSAYGLDFESVTGKVRFNRLGVMVDDLMVRYQGLPLSVKAIQESYANTNVNRIRVTGQVALASVMQSHDIPLVEKFEGTSNWNIDVNVTQTPGDPKAGVTLSATSDLSGSIVKLPLPLKKEADKLQGAQVDIDFSSPEKDWWIRLPGLLTARFRLTEDKKLETVAVALGESQNHVLPLRGIALHGDTRNVDAHGWVKFAMSFDSDGESEFPVFAKVNADQMVVGDEIFEDLIYIAYRDGNDQVHRVENEVISGEFILQKNLSKGVPLIVRLGRLDKRLLSAIGSAEKTTSDLNQVTDQLYDPREVPSLDIRVSELIWDNWRFANVAMRSEAIEDGMKITAVTVRQNSMRVSGGGYWKLGNRGDVASHSTSLDLTASFDDFGRAIVDIANVESFGRGSGEAALSLGWDGPAYSPDLTALYGQLLFNLRDGRILSVDPGAGRILGLFALQELPRRLNFDFRDITDDGLEYTGVSGNLSIANGQAKTNALAMSGPVAEILIHGSTGFVDRTYDQTIDVLPRVSGALPILGVLSGGPAGGLTALLADGVLKGIGVNLDEIGRRRLNLTGSWDEPVWEKVTPTTTPNLSR